jgi:hypothetical protein
VVVGLVALLTIAYRIAITMSIPIPNAMVASPLLDYWHVQVSPEGGLLP